MVHLDRVDLLCQRRLVLSNIAQHHSGGDNLIISRNNRFVMSQTKARRSGRPSSVAHRRNAQVPIFLALQMGSFQVVQNILLVYANSYQHVAN